MSLISRSCKNYHIIFNVETPNLEARNISLVNIITYIIEESKLISELYVVSHAQALVSGKKKIPRYYIYHKVRNRSFVKNLGHRDFRVFSTRRQHGVMAYII